MNETPLEWLVALLPMTLAAPVFALWARRFPPAERRVFAWVLAAHVLAAAAIVIVTRDVYGYGDMLKYHRTGVLIAGYVRADGSYFADVVQLIFHRESAFGFVDGAGTTTGTLHGISAILALLLFDSLPAACVAVALASASAKLALYSTFRERVHPTQRFRLAIALALIPSFVFWSSGLLKEGVAVAGLGWLVWAVAPWVGLRARAFSPRRFLVMTPAALAVALTKPYLLFPFALAAAASWYVARRRSSGLAALSPVRLTLAVIGAVGLMMALSALFPRYAADNVVEQASTLRELGATHSGGSTFQPVQLGGGGLFSHLVFAPLALVNVLFRPFLFEVRNPLMLVSSVEVTAVLVLCVRALRRGGVRRTISTVFSEPVMAFCSVYVVVLGTAVGLATTNMGTLTRYRSPMMPFLGLLLFGLAFVHPRPRAMRLRRVSAKK